MQAIVSWYASTFGSWMPEQVFVVLISMVPLIELRGGIVVARLLALPLWQANLFSIIGNIIPIPFILLFIKKIFEWMKRKNILTKFVAFCERRAEKKSKGAEKGIFIFLMLFVGIPLPGTGAWTGSLIASLYDFDIKKSSLAIFIGLIIATIIMDILAYFVPGLFGFTVG